jgi:hypothetical protein
MMKRTTIGAVTLAAALGAGVHAGKPPADTPLALNYRNADSDGVVSDGRLSLSSLPFQYVNGQADNIGAILKGGGDFLFTAQYDTSVPARRQICLDFASQPNPWGTAIHCAPANQNMAPPLDSTAINVPLTSLHYGESLEKRLQIWWDDNTSGYRYHVRYGGDMNDDHVADVAALTVTCVAPVNPLAPCAAWTVTNDGNTILGRSGLSKRGQLGPFEFLGFYDLAFEATLTAQ